MKDRIVNVVGLPTLPDQSAIEYSLAELDDVLADVVLLRDTLSELRVKWPL